MTKVYICSICNKAFTDFTSCVSHIHKEHEIPVTKAHDYIIRKVTKFKKKDIEISKSLIEFIKK